MLQISKSHIAEKLNTDPVRNGVYDLSPITGRIDVDPERTFSKRRIDDSYNRIRDLGDVSIRNSCWCETLDDLIGASNSGRRDPAPFTERFRYRTSPRVRRLNFPFADDTLRT